MGLIQARKSPPGTARLRPSDWPIPATILLLGALSAWPGPAGQLWLRYDREAIAGGQLWRLVSGHFVHLGWPHYLLNAAGIILVWLLVGHRLSPSQWLLVIGVSIIGMDLGFWLLDAELSWYVGASGLLHGLLVAGLLAGFDDARVESGLLLLLVLAKLVFEQLVGPLPGSEATAGGAVVVNAHLYGAISGAIAACIVLISASRARAI